MIGATIAALFRQTLFEELARAGARCEVICVLNGCTDRTASVAAEVFAQEHAGHPSRHAITCRIADLKERGKINAWNQFVHSLSPADAEFLFMMDADIGLPRRDTFWNMLRALEEDAEASVSVDSPRKDIEFKARKSPRDYVSLAMSGMTRSAPGQLCGQLYCIRAEVARRIQLPKDLAACEDGFIKAIVCTDFLTRPVSPSRIRQAKGAEHVFEAYTSPLTIFKNQKRQIIGQTIVHILVDQFLSSLAVEKRTRLADTVETLERDDPDWLKRLIAAHVKRTRFPWRLYPGLLSQRFKHLKRMPAWKRVLALPAAAAATVFGLLGSITAFSSLKSGDTKYWPKAPRPANPAPAEVDDAARLAPAGTAAIGKS